MLWNWNNADPTGYAGKKRTADRISRVHQGLAIAVTLLTSVLAATFTAANLTTDYSYWSRIVVWREARSDDFAFKFAARSVQAGPVPYRFARAASSVVWPLVRRSQDGRLVEQPLSQFLAATGTTAFIALKGDELIHEEYFNGAGRNSMQTSFSIAKSVDSALVGIAISEGYIASVDDPITRYLPELENRPGLNRIRIRDLLTMTSGLRYRGAGRTGGHSRTTHAPTMTLTFAD